MDDPKIIELFFLRSEEAIVQISKKYGNMCLKIAKNILKDPRDMEECVNDAYLAVWNTIPPQKPKPLVTYICRIVRNISIKKYHNNTAIKRNSFYDISLDELETCFPTLENVEDAYSVKELADVMNQFLRTLSKENRTIFVRRYWFADSISSIAKMYKVSNHNISVRLHRTREALKKYLKKEGYL